MNILKYIIGPSYWEGLKVVPIVMAAEIMMGVNFNLSFWYKLTDHPLGSPLSGIGCLILFRSEHPVHPQVHMACGAGPVSPPTEATLLSYIVGQKKYPIKYL